MRKYKKINKLDLLKTVPKAKSFHFISELINDIWGKFFVTVYNPSK